MNDLIQEVTPLTKAIVWLRPDAISPQHPHYKAIDYLLDGLLTATLKENNPESFLLVGKNFNRQLFIFASKAPEQKELNSFLSLVEKDMKAEDRILVVDDIEAREKFLKLVPQKILPHFHVIKG